MLQLRHALPQVAASDAALVLAERWGIRGEPQTLPGERDRNFYVRGADGLEFVLKFANAEDDRSLIELQNAVLAHVVARECPVAVPRVTPSLDGESIALCQIGESVYLARLLTWLPGRPLAQWRPHSPAVLRSVGESLGALGKALDDFRHPGARRPLKWDLAGADWIVEHTGRIKNSHRRSLVEHVTTAYTERIRPALAGLRTGVVHNDANDHNVLVAADENDDARVSGIIDFGDVLETHPVADLAIALAYAMMGKPDPMTAAAHVVAGYHAALALEAAELALLLPLVRTRLAVSVINSALQREIDPANEYLRVSEDGAWQLLAQLAEIHDRLAEYRFRSACGFDPCPSSSALSAWLAAPARRFSNVVAHSLGGHGVHVHDFGIDSSEIGTTDQWLDRQRFGRHVDDVLRDASARVGVGRYDEVRAIYTTDLFVVPGNDGPEWRTVHLGIDVGLPAGAEVFAPLDGTVHSVRDNTTDGDYGPTVILEHKVNPGRRAGRGPARGDALTFCTLYGHLSRETLAHVKPGDAIPAGGLIGWLGDDRVNGGWWTHLHFQLIADLLDRTGDFPGVARPADRDVWLSLSPDPSRMLGLPAAARAPRPEPAETLRERRSRHIGPSLSVSYRRPLHIVRGVMQHLLDADGRRYLDAVNNVAHVGHSHPDVVRAAQRQMAVLNTNTRYLHEHLVRYAERLTSTLPEPLRVCYFVCSGSEANELALRLARAHTGERDVVVVEAGYHGNTSTLVEISPYKFDGPGGAGAPPWVHKVPMPDTYRGPFGRDDVQSGMKYAQSVRDAVGRVRQNGRQPSAFLCESMLSCGGQIVLPPGYLAEAYRQVRAAGGVCIADEVQVGFGRVGTHRWAFQTQGVVPDIVTMGKPIGNGHPLGAVVTTPEIASSFANGMEYFNTFGGNPVSCAIGMAVLDVMEREGLQAHALQTGDYLMSRLRSLGDTFPLLGDVRGLGLFIGVELVTDRDQRIPATRQATYVANRMRDGGLLMSTDGPDNNVLKIKPPLCFTERDADFLVETMARVLEEDPGRGRRSAERWSTGTERRRSPIH